MTLLLCFAAITSGQETSDTAWLTGEPLARQLDSRVGVTWASAPLRQKMLNLSQQLRVAIFLDRRIDPSQELELSLPEMPVRQCLESIATRLEAGACLVGPVAYIGPRSVATKLATVAALRNDEISRLPAAARERLSRSAAWRWNMLSTPKELLAQLANEAGVAVAGAEQIPHDLWAAGDLPPLTFAERMTLVLAGFDRTFELDGPAMRLRLVPLPANPVLIRSYPAELERAISGLRRVAPEAQVKREGSRILVSGSAEDHDTISRLVRKEKVRQPAAGQGKTVYTMSNTAQLGTILKSVQVQAELNVIVDPRIQSKLYERVTIAVKEVSLEELIAAILKDTGLKYELSGRELKIFP